jgi:2-polyprenyl-6-methoxyphenol hydroxylase-like FAD-dependent oxidoreductase
MGKNYTILIVGGGIGGLTLGVALRRAGFTVRIFERAAVLRPVGAGISMQTNAMLAFRTIGLDKAVAGAGQTMLRGSILDTRGRPLSSMPVKEIAEEAGAPTVVLHRSRLQDVLLEALGPGILSLDTRVVSFRDTPDGVFVQLPDGSEVQGDLLVGADGLRSAVRAQLVNDGEPRYSGYTSWRGVCETPGLVDPFLTTETWGPGIRFGIFPIGETTTYWFTTVNAPQGGIDGPDVRSELLGRLAGWHDPIRSFIERTPAPAIVRNDILDRPPIGRWVYGRVALLGDAAHPMTPNMGQGGCQAVEDAVVLARCLASEADVPAALARYEALRIPRANGFVVQSFRLGEMGQWENPAACWLRDRLLQLMPARSMRANLLRAARFMPP